MYNQANQSRVPAHRPEAIAVAFERATHCASAFRGNTSPNPPVGCAVLDVHGNILAVAAHEKAGQPHAEVRALAKCRNDGITDQIHTLIVTLEPCNHTGRTPPCVQAILASPVREVWIGARDPNPVAGGGIESLRKNGLTVMEVETFDPSLGRLTKALLAPFSKRIVKKLPWITVKQAINRAGTMLPPPGQKTFTSMQSLTLAHRLRKQADAILTGSGTILADDPQFTVRHTEDFADKRRTLLITDRRGRVTDSQLLAFARRGLDAQRIDDIEHALLTVAANGALEVLVEAGPTLTTDLLRLGLWDTLVSIHQGTGGEPDRIVVEHRNEKDLPVYEEDNVFRHY